MRKEIVMSPRIGRPYSATTAHGTRAGGFVFVTGQVANKPGTDPLCVDPATHTVLAMP